MRFLKVKLLRAKKKKQANFQSCDAIAELFRIFGDSTRCKVVSSLFNSSKKVGDLSSELDMSISAISHSLRILRQAKIVKSSRAGREITYSLEDEHIFKIFQMAKEHIEE